MAIYVNGIRRDGAGNGRRPTAYDFSDASSGVITETVDGDISTEYAITRDSSGRINSFTAPDGHVTEIDWGGAPIAMRIEVVTAYPAVEESGVLYIKVESST